MKEFRETRIIRTYAQAAWDCFTADETDLACIPSLEDQRTFLQVAETMPAGVGFYDGCDEEDNWNFEEMVSVGEAAAPGVRDMFGKIQLICEEGGEALPTTVVEVIELAREVDETKRIHAVLVKLHSWTLKELYSSQAAERLVRKDLETSNAKLTTLRARLDVVSTLLTKAQEVAAKA